MEEQSPFDPRVFLRRFHQTYVNFARLWKRFGVPPGVVLRSPADEPISLPPIAAAALDGLDSVLREKGTEVRFVKYMQSLNGKPSLVVEDESGLPPVEGIVVVTLTTSVVTASSYRVVTDVYVGERR
jgi:hypothetical protein